MADQGALGRYHDTPTSSSYNPAKKHYQRGPSGTAPRIGPLSGVTRTTITNTAALRAVWHYVRVGDRHTRFNTTAIGIYKDIIANMALLRAKPRYVRKSENVWIDTVPMPMSGEWYNWAAEIARFLPMNADILMSGGGSGFVRTDGSITGVVTENGTPVAAVDVVLIWRPLMSVIGYARTNASGVYLFTGLDPTFTAKYAVIAFDPAGGTVYNIGRLDLLTPG
jgi:hypothetical protein